MTRSSRHYRGRKKAGHAKAWQQRSFNLARKGRQAATASVFEIFAHLPVKTQPILKSSQEHAPTGFRSGRNIQAEGCWVHLSSPATISCDMNHTSTGFEQLSPVCKRSDILYLSLPGLLTYKLGRVKELDGDRTGSDSPGIIQAPPAVLSQIARRLCHCEEVWRQDSHH